MITGKPPWSQQYTSHVSAMFHIANTTQPPPLPESISLDARDFILQCLQREPRNRPNATRLLVHPFVTQSLTIHGQGVAGPLNSFDASMTASGLNFPMPMALLAAGQPMPLALAAPTGPLAHVPEGSASAAASAAMFPGPPVQQPSHANNNNHNIDNNNNNNGYGMMLPPAALASSSSSSIPPQPQTNNVAAAVAPVRPNSGRLRASTGSGGGSSIANSMGMSSGASIMTSNSTPGGSNMGTTSSMQPGHTYGQLLHAASSAGPLNSSMTHGNSSLISNVAGFNSGANTMTGPNGTIHGVAIIPPSSSVIGISPTPSTYTNQPSPSAFALLPDPPIANVTTTSTPQPPIPTFVHSSTTPTALAPAPSSYAQSNGQPSPTTLAANNSGAPSSVRQTSPRPFPAASSSAASMAAAALVAQIDGPPTLANGGGITSSSSGAQPPSPNGGPIIGVIPPSHERYSPHASPTDDTKQRQPHSGKRQSPSAAMRPQLLVQASAGGSGLRLSPSGYNAVSDLPLIFLTRIISIITFYPVNHSVHRLIDQVVVVPSVPIHEQLPKPITYLEQLQHPQLPHRHHLKQLFVKIVVILVRCHHWRMQV
jgi:serine/threonine protein kinase